MEKSIHPTKILVVGSGGRENSLAWAITKTKSVQKVFVTPGNGGTEAISHCKRLDVPDNDPEGLIKTCKNLQIDFIIIGPEAPLAAGLAQRLRNAGLIVFGPCAKGAQLEASKSWAKALMEENGIPTAKHWVPRSKKEALTIVNQLQKPLVVKADGLAAGKGVIVTNSIEQTKSAIKEIFEGKFGSTNVKLILEEKLSGPEVSIFALCDGNNLIILPAAQDHKRLLDGDKGPNTGGMGAYVPAPLINNEKLKLIKNRILIPTLDGLKRKGINYRGVIYAGLMLTDLGPKVIEFNCRFGDPECQALMPLMGDEFVNVLYSCAIGNLDQSPHLSISESCSACVVLAAEGYPENPRKSDKIDIKIQENSFMQIFHAGTELNSDNQLKTSGGRVLSVVAQSQNFDDAFNIVYKSIDKINFKGALYRKDIGYQVRETYEHN